MIRVRLIRARRASLDGRCGRLAWWIWSGFGCARFLIQLMVASSTAIAGFALAALSQFSSEDIEPVASFRSSDRVSVSTTGDAFDLIACDEIGMPGEIRAGWPVRRFAPNSHSCLAGESGGVSWGAWFACCPQGTYPKGSREDRWCDGRNDAPGNSTSHPQCADSKWKLWTLDGRYFCCDDGNEDRGYYYTNSEYYYFGCASDDWIANTNASVRRAGSYPNPPASPSPTNKGAIAGGVVGGVCGALIIVGIVWFLCRRRRRQQKAEGIPATPNNAALQSGARYESIPNELGDDRHEAAELDGSVDRKEAPATARQELAGVTPGEQQPAELP